MRTWHIVFKGDAQNNPREEEWEYDEAQYKSVKKTMAVDGREVIGMWVIDSESEQEDVIKHDGDRIPHDIRVRHEERKRRLRWREVKKRLRWRAAALRKRRPT